MNARPIIFNGDMVRALLDGRKTQTRRPIDPQPVEAMVTKFPFPKMRGSLLIWSETDYSDFPMWKYHHVCPFGKPGDLLWVRETFAILRYLKTIEVGFAYRADGDLPFGWSPSIHMPRKASRLTLRITDVRVERVQDISECNAKAEGAIPDGTQGDSHICAFAETVWGGIYNTDHNPQFAWGRNPWVWVIGFEVIRKNVDEVMANV